MKKRRIVCVVISLAVFLTLWCFATELTRPKYMASSREGALIGEYYLESDAGSKHDVIFVGDCEVYECFVPPILWEDYGIRSYVRGSPGQLIWQSYYLLEEMLGYETPKVVVFNVLSMKYGEPQKEAYNRMAIDGMRISSSKISAIRASMSDKESFASYLFPLLRYHSRISQLEKEDIEYLFRREKVSHNGYMMKVGVGPMEIGAVEELIDYSLPKISFDYLDKMRVLCEQNQVELVLIKSPTNTWKYWWYDEWDRQIRDYAEKNQIDYYNLINEEIGIDPSGDYFDGVHLNVFGAEKLSRFFGRILSEKYLSGQLCRDPSVSEIWDGKVAEYYNEKRKITESKK